MRITGLVSLLFVVACATSSNITQFDHPPLHLVLALDGVGYSTVKKLHEGGYFREFYQPAPMIASFPSLSDPNWSRLMGAPITESYTKAFFDIKLKTKKGLGQPVGSLMNHIMEAPQYETGFDFKAEGPLQHLAILTWTETSAMYWLDALEKELLEARGKDTYFAFIMNTDIIAHIQGERPLMQYLVEVDKRLARLRSKLLAEFGYPLHITIVSDHGNYWTKPVQVDYEGPLKSKGWKLVETLTTPNDVAFVVPEIVAFASMYTLPGQEKRLAQDISSVEGVLMAAHAIKPNVVEITANNGKDVARVTVDPRAETVSYDVIRGQDILNQKDFFKGKTITWKHYFLESYKSDYPYAAIRIWEGFYKNSKTAGSILVSPKVGRVFANQTLKMLTALRGLSSTHGGLHQLETAGVVMSTREPAPPIRPEDFGTLVNLQRYKDNLKPAKLVGQFDNR